MSATLALTQTLICCPSMTPNDAGCQAIISERLARIGFHCEHLRIGAVDNLWACYGHQPPLMVFAGHTDVVPPGPLSEWTSPPFQPTIRDEYLYGRGATDMKGGIAAMVVAVEKFVQAHPSFPGTIAFLITSDEEGVAQDGTQQVIHLLQERGTQIHFAIVGEASSERQAGDQIRVGRRGSLHGKLTIRGKQGHVAFPALAQNPIHLSALALHELAQTQWDQGNHDFPPTTFQISNLHAGTGVTNVIPGHLEGLFNFRFSTAITAHQLQEKVAAILHKHQLDFTINWETSAHPFLTRQGKLLSTVQQAIREVTGLDTIRSTAGGTSDARFIAATGAEVIELGVPSTTAHQANECVAIHSLTALTDIYYRLLTLLF